MSAQRPLPRSTAQGPRLWPRCGQLSPGRRGPQGCSLSSPFLLTGHCGAWRLFPTLVTCTRRVLRVTLPGLCGADSKSDVNIWEDGSLAHDEARLTSFLKLSRFCMFEIHFVPVPRTGSSQLTGLPGHWPFLCLFIPSLELSVL